MSSSDTKQALRIAMPVVDGNEVSHQGKWLDKKPSPAVHTAVENLLDGLKKHHGIEVYVLYAHSDAPSEHSFRQDGALRFVPVHYRPIKWIPGIGGAFIARTIALLRAIKKISPELVHGQGTERESGLVAALSGCTSIVTLHGNMREIAKSVEAKPLSYLWLAAKLEKWVLKHVDAVHCISSHTKESVRTFAKKTFTIPNAASEPFFKATRNPASYPYVVCIAGITEWKNPRLLVVASKKFRDVFQNAEIHFFGHADLASEYAAEFMNEISNTPWCYFHGELPAQEIISHLVKATCLVLPSKMENCPLVLLESMAMGIPIVASKVGGVPDIVQHKETGYLFNPGNPDELSEALIQVHEEGDNCAIMERNSRNVAISKYSIPIVTEAHLKMYRELTDQ